MKTYTIALEVSEDWLEAIQRVTDVDVEEGEILRWLSVEEAGE